MDPGKLKHQMLLQEPGTTQDDVGQVTPGFTTVATVRAAVLAPSGIETVRAGGEVSIGRVSVRIRARPGVVATMRLLHGVVAYNIIAVPPVNPDRRYIDLPCEVVNAGS